MTEKLGIVGGNGLMGQWFKSFFENEGIAVEICDLNAGPDLKELFNRNKSIMFSVPMSKVTEIIESAKPFVSENHLLMDITSIKVPAVNSMLQSPAEVLGLHPMYGPKIPNMNNQNIVVCKARPKLKTNFYLNLFEKAGAKLSYHSPEEHDFAMTFIQGLFHFLSISTAYTIQNNNIDLELLENLSSSIFNINLDLIGRILAQNPQIYSEIAIENPLTINTINSFFNSSEDLFEAIKGKDYEKYTQIFNISSLFFENLKDKALEESNILIKTINKSKAA